ncbi:right-handed parallel beta-helix repeat-containing protein [Paludibacter jiangxiensis]|uniref:Right handed beta helix region protein n=1 Tax=Paludibacter jiangxiensis TaxID=681398 RepID=A0A161LX57_9BACT|nr:right-handed parallel beta-helix repeat-containing protein [Paludibacter jiangxiensis]GAT63992.1 right handed beta helix region protein [Paludibacter jiangxiensis]
MPTCKNTLLTIVCFLTLQFTDNVFGTVYYVSKSGNDAFSYFAAQNKTSPKQTIAAGIRCLSAGDTLYIREGIYNEAINEYRTKLPSGNSWQTAVTIAGYPGEKVIIQPNASESEVLRLMGSSGGTRYVIFDNLILDGANVTSNIVKITYTGNNPNNTAHHIRIQSCELKQAKTNGIFVDSESNHNEFISLKIHDNGTTDFDHGMYICGSNNLIEKCDIYRNAGWGIHIYTEHKPESANYNIVRRNNIHENARAENRGFGIIVSSGTGNSVYNNLIWGNNGGIQIDYHAVNTIIYNNTIWSNNRSKTHENGIKTGAGSTNARIVNNISWNHIAGNISNAGINTYLSNNLTDKSPLFVNSSKSDFRLQEKSPAINTGKNLAPLVTDDYNGIRRPQGSTYDIGAFEYKTYK